jgi:hypothetical protein
MIDVGRDLERMRDYVVGRLPDEEQQAFEERLGRDPELVRELEQSLRLREGLEELRSQGYFTRAPAPRRARSWTWVPALASAAVLALVMFLWVEPSRVPTGAPESPATLVTVTAGAPVTAHFTFLTTREATTPRLELPASGLIELRAAPAERSAQSGYRVTLLREAGSGSSGPVGAVSNLVLTRDGYVRAYADASHLTPGAYSVRVEAVGEPQAPTAEFPFILEPATATHGGSASQ